MALGELWKSPVFTKQQVCKSHGCWAEIFEGGLFRPSLGKFDSDRASNYIEWGEDVVMFKEVVVYR